jgi:hypothetical protein
MSDISNIASDQIIKSNNLMTLTQETITQMRTQKTSATRN